MNYNIYYIIGCNREITTQSQDDIVLYIMSHIKNSLSNSCLGIHSLKIIEELKVKVKKKKTIQF